MMAQNLAIKAVSASISLSRTELFMTKERLKEILRFLLSGGFCFLIDYGLLFILTEYGGLYYLCSSAISFSISLGVNYWLCIHFIFRKTAEQTSRQKMIFIIVGIMGLGLNQLCMWLFATICGLHYMIAKLFATAIVTIWNYLTKRWAVT